MLSLADFLQLQDQEVDTIYLSSSDGDEYDSVSVSVGDESVVISTSAAVEEVPTLNHIFSNLLTLECEGSPDDTNTTYFNLIESCLSSATRLKNLCFSFLPFPVYSCGDDPVIEFIAKSRLESLDFYRCNQSVARVKEIFFSLPKTLKILKMEGDFIGDDGALALASILPYLHQLEVLSLSPLSFQTPASQITDVGAIFLFNSLSSYGKVMKELSIPGNSLTDRSFRSIASFLSKSTTLRKLDISNTLGFTGNGFIHVTESLKYHPSLTDLTLTLQSEQNMTALSTLIRTNKSLDRITINKPPFQTPQESATSLITALNENTTLTYFESYTRSQPHHHSFNFAWTDVYDATDTRLFKTSHRNPSLHSHADSKYASEAVVVSRLLAILPYPPELKDKIIDLVLGSCRGYSRNDRVCIRNMLGMYKFLGRLRGGVCTWKSVLRKCHWLSSLL